MSDALKTAAALARDAREIRSSSWKPIDLTSFLDGSYVDQMPEVLTRTDGNGLLYSGRVNGVHAPSGEGKSWVAAAAMVQEMAEGRSVLLIDFEDHPGPWVTRLLQIRIRNDRNEIAIDASTIANKFTYIHPRDPSDEIVIADLRSIIDMLGVSLVVIDSVGESMGLDGTNQNSDDEVVRWTNRISRPLADTGATVLLIDHVTKDTTSAKKSYAIGSGRKRAGIDGATFSAEQTQRFSRKLTGTIKLTCEKDRHGHYATKEVAALIEMEPDGDTLLITIRPPEMPELAADGLYRPTIYIERVSKLLARNSPLTQNGLFALKRGGVL
jgi:hypothetical protein